MDTFECGHPKSPENTTKNGASRYGKCKTCHNAAARRDYHSVPKETRQTVLRMKKLPWLVVQARKNLKLLEDEARRYGMVELFERGDV